MSCGNKSSCEWNGRKIKIKKRALHRKGAAMGGNHVQRVKVETCNAKLFRILYTLSRFESIRSEENEETTFFFFFGGRCLLLFWCCVVTFRWWDTHRLFSFFYQERERVSESIDLALFTPWERRRKKLGRRWPQQLALTVWYGWIGCLLSSSIIPSCFSLSVFDSSLHINSCVYSIPLSYGLFCGRCAGRRNGPFEKRRVSLLYTITKGVETVRIPANYFSSSHQPSAVVFFPSGISLSLYPARFSIRSSLLSLPRFSLSSLFLSFSFFPFCPLAGLKNEPECRLKS